MSEALSDAWAKWARARDRLPDLYRTSTRGSPDDVAPSSARLGRHIDVADSTLVVTVDEVPELVSEAAIVLSEAAFHFRTALDCVVRELAWIDTRGDPRLADQGQHFPIVSAARDWDSACVRAALQGVSTDHVNMIKRLQPYRPWSGSNGEIHPLRVLDALVHDDRQGLLPLAYSHAASSVSVGAFRCTDCRVDRRRQRGKRVHLGAKSVAHELREGAELARVPLVITGPHPRVEFDGRVPTYVAVGPGLSVVQNLASITEFVRQALQLFEPEFARPRLARIWRKREGRLEALPRPSDIDATRVLRGIAPHAPRPVGGRERCRDTSGGAQPERLCS